MLSQFTGPASTCQRITNFLTDRRQEVRLGSITYGTWTISTGAPRGCFIFSLLFTLYTNNCNSGNYSVKLLKCANDTRIISLIKDGDESAYRQEVEQLVHWCKAAKLNMLRTVQMVVHFRRDPSSILPFTILNKIFSTNDTLRFLGTKIFRNLPLSIRIDSSWKTQAQQRK